MASTECDSQMDKPEHGHPKRAELPDVNITHAHKALRVRASLNSSHKYSSPCSFYHYHCFLDIFHFLENRSSLFKGPGNKDAIVTTF